MNKGDSGLHHDKRTLQEQLEAIRKDADAIKHTIQLIERSSFTGASAPAVASTMNILGMLLNAIDKNGNDCAARIEEVNRAIDEAIEMPSEEIAP